jgi:hypothetical protein
MGLARYSRKWDHGLSYGSKRNTNQAVVAVVIYQVWQPVRIVEINSAGFGGYRGAEILMADVKMMHTSREVTAVGRYIVRRKLMEGIVWSVAIVCIGVGREASARAVVNHACSKR